MVESKELKRDRVIAEKYSFIPNTHYWCLIEGKDFQLTYTENHTKNSYWDRFTPTQKGYTNASETLPAYYREDIEDFIKTSKDDKKTLEAMRLLIKEF